MDRLDSIQSNGNFVKKIACGIIASLYPNDPKDVSHFGKFPH
jgi:hypothetical protein